MAAWTPAQVRMWKRATPKNGVTYSWSDVPACTDFNRGIYPPGYDPDYPEGFVEVRTDDDFWLCARLPYAARETPVEILVQNLWPDFVEEHGEKISYNRDYGPEDNPLPE